MKPSLCLLVLLLTSISSASDVHVVDRGGGGDFLDLQSAADAASTGDTLLVKQGSYGPLTLDGKGLTVAADLGHIVSVLGGVIVRNTDGAQPVALLRLRSLGDHDPRGITEHGVLLEACAGSVRIEGCVLKAADGDEHTRSMDHGGDALHMEACADVALMGCTLLGGRGGESFENSGWPQRAGHGIAASAGSLVTLHQCTATAGDAQEFDLSTCDMGGREAHGAWILDSRLYAAGTSLTGGLGGSEGLCGASWPGGDGLRVEGTGAHADLLEVNLTGGPSNSCGSRRVSRCSCSAARPLPPGPGRRAA